MSQRVWRNVSPSTSKQGPIKAVIQFSLKNNSSASKSSNSSPSPTTRDIKNNERRRGTQKSPDHRISPERRSPVSPNQKEKSKCHRQSPAQLQYLSVSSALRASSADPVLSYLTGWWSKDINSYHHSRSGVVFMCDKSTQTIVDVEHTATRKSKGHRRSASFGHGDLSKEVIKQRLQKTKEGSRQDWNKQRWSPVPGVHSALSLTAPPAVFAQSKPTIVIPPNTHIPTRHKMSRLHGSSVEALNVEVQKLVLSKPGTSSKTSAGQEKEEENLRAQGVPDGHRAPVPMVTRLSSTRSVDTQTPSAQAEEPQPAVDASPQDSASLASSGPAAVSCTTDLHPESRSESVESKSSKGDSESPEPSKFVSSPKPEKCPFVRQPPDGCEKVTVIEETRRPSIKETLLFCPVKPNQFIFKQSQGSAFCPLIKQYLGETGDPQTLCPTAVPLSVPSISAPSHSPTVESQ